MLPDLISSTSRQKRKSKTRRKQRSKQSRENRFFAKADDDGTHAYAKVLKLALQDPLQKFRYRPCRTSVQIPVQFRGITDLRRSARLPKMAPQLAWVYGHSASNSHASRVVVTKLDEIVYPAGKVVVVVRKGEGKLAPAPQQRSASLIRSPTRALGSPALQTGRGRKQVQPFRQRFFLHHSSPVTCIALHPDGVHVVTGQGGDNPHMLVWSTRTLKPKSGLLGSSDGMGTSGGAGGSGDASGDAPVYTGSFTSYGRFGFVPEGMDVTDRREVRSVHLDFNPDRRTSGVPTRGGGGSQHTAFQERIGMTSPPGSKPFYGPGSIHAVNFVAGGQFVVACGADNGHRMGIWDWHTGQLLAYHHNTFKDDASQINDIIPMVDVGPGSYRQAEVGTSSSSTKPHRKKSKARGRSSQKSLVPHRINWLTIGANHIKFWSYEPHAAEVFRAENRKNKKKPKGNFASSKRSANKNGSKVGAGKAKMPKTANRKASSEHHFYTFGGIITATTDLAGYCNPYFDGDHDIPRRTWAAVCDEASGHYVSGGSFNCIFVWAMGSQQTTTSAETGGGATSILPPRILPTNQTAGVHSLAVVLHTDHNVAPTTNENSSKGAKQQHVGLSRRASSPLETRSPSPFRGHASNDLSAHLLKHSRRKLGSPRSRRMGGGSGEPYDTLFAGCGNGVVVEWRRPARYGYNFTAGMSVTDWAVAGGGWLPHASYDLHTPLNALNTMRPPAYKPPPEKEKPKPPTEEELRMREAAEMERLVRQRAKDSLRRKMGRLSSPLPATSPLSSFENNHARSSDDDSDEDSDGGDDWSELDQIERVKRRLERACAKAGLKRDWALLFERMDADGSGGLDPDEFRRALRKFGHVRAKLLSDADVDVLFHAVDTSGDGTIQQHEFTAFMNFTQVKADASETASIDTVNENSEAQKVKASEGASKKRRHGGAFASYKERRVDYTGTSEFTITSMAPYHGVQGTASVDGSTSPRFSGDHWLVLGCRNGDVWEAQLRTGQLRNVTYGHRARVNDVTNVPRPVTRLGPAATAMRGACFVSCSENGHLRVWDARQHRQIAHHLLHQPAKAVSASPDGLLVAAGFGDGSFALYDLGDVCLECTTPAYHFPPSPASASKSGTAVGLQSSIKAQIGFGSTSSRKSFANVGQTFGGGLGAAAGADNGMSGASAKESAGRRAGVDVAIASGPSVANTKNGAFYSVSVLAFSPDGTLLAVAGNDSLIHIWEAKATCVCKAHHQFELRTTLKGHVAGVTGLDWAANSGYLRSCCQTNELLHWDVLNGSQITSGVDALALRTKWDTETCLLGFHAMGIWDAQKLVLGSNGDREMPVVALGATIASSASKRTTPSAVAGGGKRAHFRGVDDGGLPAIQPARSKIETDEEQYLIVGTDSGSVQLFNSPCIVEDAPHFGHSGGHSGALASVCHMPALREFVTVSTTDTVMLQWQLKPTSRKRSVIKKDTLQPANAQDGRAPERGPSSGATAAAEAPSSQDAGKMVKEREVEDDDEDDATEGWDGASESHVLSTVHSDGDDGSDANEEWDGKFSDEEDETVEGAAGRGGTGVTSLDFSNIAATGDSVDNATLTPTARTIVLEELPGQKKKKKKKKKKRRSQKLSGPLNRESNSATLKQHVLPNGGGRWIVDSYGNHYNTF